MRDKVYLNIEPAFETNSDTTDLTYSNTFIYRSLEIKREKYLFTIDKYLVLIKDFSEVAKINNYAVDLVLAGEYEQAKILLNATLEENQNIAEIRNNLGVANELDKNYEEALRNYSIACELDLENKKFLQNKMTLLESGKTNVKR